MKAIDAIYQGTDFMGIRNISFMVKRIRVSAPLQHHVVWAGLNRFLLV